MDSFNDVLAAAKEYCKQRLVDATYNLYIDGLEAVRFEGSGKVTLAVRNDFICTIVRDRYTPLLREALAAVLGFDVEVELVANLGGLAIGAATEEEKRTGINAWKRRRLIGVGAAAIIPDFRDSDEILKMIRG